MMEQYTLRWNDYTSQITDSFGCFRNEEDLVDVTLSCEGKKLKAHKILLSACSPYFRDVFKENPCQHPVIVFKNISHTDLEAILDFVYKGEVSVEQERLNSFLDTADLLKVKGLTSDSVGDTNTNNEEENKEDPKTVKASKIGKGVKKPSKSLPERNKMTKTVTNVEPPSKKRKIPEEKNNFDLIQFQGTDVIQTDTEEPITIKIEDEEVDVEGDEFSNFYDNNDVSGRFSVTDSSTTTSRSTSLQSVQGPSKPGTGRRSLGEILSGNFYRKKTEGLGIKPKRVEHTKGFTQSVGAACELSSSTKRLHKFVDKFQKDCSENQLLSSKEESEISYLIKKINEWGFIMSRYEMRLLVKSYLQDKGRIVPQFLNNFPGEAWLDEFLRGHKDLQQIKLGRSVFFSKLRNQKVDKDEVTQYLRNLEEIIDGTPPVAPSNILHYDEIYLGDNLNYKMCVMTRTQKYPELSMSRNMMTGSSVMFAGTASGELLPAYVCLKADVLLESWTLGGPEGVKFNHSKSGWFNEETFLSWFLQVVIPWAAERNGVKVLLGDSFSTHFSPQIISLCEDFDIKFIALPTNSSCLHQPFTSVFLPKIEESWKNIMTAWKHSEGLGTNMLPRDQFPSLLKELCQTVFLKYTRTSLIAGFKNCGICSMDT